MGEYPPFIIIIAEDKVGLAKEETLNALKQALVSVAGDKLRISVVDALPAGTNKIGSIDVDNFPTEYPLPSTQITDLKQVEQKPNIVDGNQFTGTYASTAAGETTIISGVSGKTIKVYDYYLWNSGTADVGVTLKFGTSGKTLFKGKLAPKTGVIKSFVRPWEGNDGDSLVLALDDAGTVDYGIGAVQA